MPRLAQPPHPTPPSRNLEAELSTAREQLARLARERDRLAVALESARDRIVALERVAQSRDQHEGNELADVRQIEDNHAREITIARGVIETLERQCERADARATAYRTDLEAERQKTKALRRQVAELATRRRKPPERRDAPPPPSLERHQRPTVELAAVH